MTKKRLIPAALIAVLFIAFAFAPVARAASNFSFSFSQINPLTFIGGVTSGGTTALPTKMNADGDGVTGHLVVDCSTGCSGSSSTTFPYNAAAGGQAATLASFLGIAGYNGATVDPLQTVNAGQLKITLYDPAGDPSNIVANGADALSNTGISGLNDFSYTMGFNGTTWDRLRVDASKNLNVNVNAALPAGANTIGSIANTAFALNSGSNTVGTFLPPLTGVSGTGTAQAAGQMIVSGCAFNSALPTITSGNVGPVQCDTTGHPVLAGAGTAGTPSGGVLTVQGVTSMTPFLITPPLTGLNSTGTAAAANQAIVASCNFTTAPATVTTANVVPVSCNNKAQVINDIQSVAASAITTATGVSGQHIYPANISGGGCAGINLSTGTQITRVNLAPVTITASEAATQIVALAASKFIHICGITISGVLSTGGAINILTGTGLNCVTGTATLATYQFGVNTAGFVYDKGTGEQSIMDSATASEICVSSGAFVSTQAVTLNLTYAQY